jgi:hypothetical protein
MMTWHRAPLIRPGSWLDDFVGWLGDALSCLWWDVTVWLDDEDDE